MFSPLLYVMSCPEPICCREQVKLYLFTSCVNRWLSVLICVWVCGCLCVFVCVCGCCAHILIRCYQMPSVAWQVWYCSLVVFGCGVYRCGCGCFFFFFFLRDFIFKKTLFEKLQYLKQEWVWVCYYIVCQSEQTKPWECLFFLLTEIGQ